MSRRPTPPEVAIPVTCPLVKAGLSWVFMFKHDHLPGFLQGYELNGFAYASTVGYSVQLGLLLYIVFHLRRHHAQYWRGWCAQRQLLLILAVLSHATCVGAAGT